MKISSTSDAPQRGGAVRRGDHRGWVLDPASGTDAVLDVGIAGDRIAAVGEGLAGARTIDARGRVVAPGFVDLHGHCDDIPGLRLQAFDGVTTALELEIGRYLVAAAYERAARAGRPINYGFATSWGAVRTEVLAGVPGTGAIADVLTAMSVAAWQQAAAPAALDRVIGMIEADLAAGALDVGVPVGYAAGVAPAEYGRVAAAAARAGRPTYAHARELVEQNPDTLVDGAEEIVRAAGETGAHMHYCHVNSTPGQHLDRVHRTA